MGTDWSAQVIAREHKPGVVELSFRYDRSIIAKVKQIPGRRYDAQARCWYIPSECLPHAMKIGFTPQGNLVADLHLHKEKNREPDRKLWRAARQLVPSLRKYQLEGVQAICDAGGRVLLGDEMGLGKTLQTLTWLRLNAESALPALILCPAHLRGNWYEEIEKWWPEIVMRTLLVKGKSQPLCTDQHSIVIASYNSVSSRVEKDKDDPSKRNVDASIVEARQHFKTVVCDECHYIKNSKTGRSFATKSLAQRAEYFVPISGTPLLQKPEEFFATLNLLRPDIFRSWWDFAKRYCGMKHNGFGWQTNGATNVEELHELVQSIMIRRRKVDVEKDLPEKQRIVVPVELSSVAEYAKREKELFADEELMPLQVVGELRRCAAELKVKSAAKWIREFLDSTGRKLVVFSVHHKITDALEKEFPGVCLVADGRSKNKQALVNQFQTDDSVRVIFCGLQAMGTGVTLTAASDVAFVELGWVPSELDQAEDRVHRIGQTAGAVTAWYLIAHDTIEDSVVSILDAKRRVVVAVVDGEEVEDKALLGAQTENEMARLILKQEKQRKGLLL